MAPGGSQSAYAPVNETTRPGLLRYVWSDDGETESARRLDAYERMWYACDGKYRILDEEARTRAVWGGFYPQRQWSYCDDYLLVHRVRMRERLGSVLSGSSLKYKCHDCQAHLIEGLVSEGHNLGFAFTSSLESAHKRGLLIELL